MIKLYAPLIGVSVLMLAGGLALAGPAAADDTEWEMPDLVGATLEEAEVSVAALSDQIAFQTKDMTGLGRAQRSPANWTVCATVPEAGDTITADSTVGFLVVRQYDESCG